MPERANSAPVGIVGLGLMGEVYAQRLIQAGIPVTGIDIDPARNARLADIGGRPAPSIADLAKSARCIILAVFNTDQVEDVVENKLLPALGEGFGKDRPVHEHLRPGSGGCARKSCQFLAVFAISMCPYPAPAIRCAVVTVLR